jgi:O-acetyl-ADP-ribose deacetylase (regulator of RNase III)
MEMLLRVFDTVNVTSPGALVARLVVHRSCSRVSEGIHERRLQNVTVRAYGGSVETSEEQRSRGANVSCSSVGVFKYISHIMGPELSQIFSDGLANNLTKLSKGAVVLIAMSRSPPAS